MDLFAPAPTSNPPSTNAPLAERVRPRTLEEFVGQERLKENLGIALQAAKKRKEPLEHLLFSGPPGLGKTSLAHIVAHEMGAKIMATSGPAIERAGDLIGILTNLEAGDILFIDEIHRLSKVVEEFIYPAMEDCKIDFVVDKGPYQMGIVVRNEQVGGRDQRADAVRASLIAIVYVAG